MSPDKLRAALDDAEARSADPEHVLIHDCHVSKRVLLEVLSEYYHCPSIEYDERMPIPPELLEGPGSDELAMRPWFPVIRDGDTVIIATNDPAASGLRQEVARNIRAEQYVFWVALKEDIGWYIQDYLHTKAGELIGTERTGLAFWRNTMAQWRTRLACYRNDLAKARTDLAFMRWGLGMIAIADTLIRTRAAAHSLLWTMMAAGLSLSLPGLTGYLNIRRSRISPPGHQTLVEVTAASLHFLEHYHFIDGTEQPSPTKQTMLARLGDFLASHCTILNPSPPSRERTHLARERNVLAAQRTVAACYRTIYARARTGLAFIRTGVSFTSLGFGLLSYFTFGVMSFFDSLLFIAGILMIADGLIWYLPVRKEQAEIPRCPVPQEL
ncbi:MAG: type II secretion protein [Nitrospirae bacterium]|nr:type II secretion protein [Nitrospirota bacterium]